MRYRIALVLALLSLTCKKEAPPEPPPPPPPPPAYVRTIHLTVVDTGLTDAYLRVRFLDTIATRAFRLHRDGQPVLTVAAAPADTVLLQDSLTLGRAYTYRAYRLLDTLVIDSSLSVSLSTLDSTSHEFTFQTFEFGQHSSSVFNDVAIIDENNIWAVGEVYLQDSIDQIDGLPYNLARWDGASWRLSRVMFPDCGPNGNEVGTGPHPAQSVFALSANDIWLASSVSLVHWDGQIFQRICMPFGFGEWGFTKILAWQNKFYLVGLGGWIAYYNGSTWQRIASGTTLDIYDIWGDSNRVTGEQEVYAVAAELAVSPARKILKVTPQGVQEMPTTNIPSSLIGIWFDPNHRYIVVGDGMYEIGRMGDPWVRNTALPPLYKHSIDGIRLNDIVAGGAFWLLAHYNGSSWRTYFPSTSGSFNEVAIKRNLIVGVGSVGNRALIAQGRR